MKDVLEFVVHYGYALLFVWVLIEQAGLPIPAAPLLLAAGALAGQGRMHLALAILVSALASLCADTFWYSFGKRRGAVVLNWLCRIALEPDSCVRRTETTFTRFGARTLLICKFVPGLNTAAPTLSGMVGVDFPRFVLFDFLGALLWTSAFAGLGFLFSKQLDLIAAGASRFGGSIVMLSRCRCDRIRVLPVERAAPLHRAGQGRPHHSRRVETQAGIGRAADHH